MESSIHIEKIKEYIDRCMLKGDLHPDDLVQIIEHNNTYINLKTIPKYAKDNNISDSGARRYRKVLTLFGVKFIADNE